MRIMPQQTIILGNARNVTQSVVGQVADLIILVKLIVFHAMQPMHLRTIIQANARVATLLLVGQELSLTIAD